MTGLQDAEIHWEGLDHIVLDTADLDATVRFYHGLLGMPLLSAFPDGPLHGRHVLFACGKHSALHFFELAQGEGAADEGSARAGHMRLAFGVPDERALVALRARLEAAGVQAQPIATQAGGHAKRFEFTDNNGVTLEAVWSPPWPNPEEAVPPDARHVVDPRPVPAVTELLRDGRLHHPWKPDKA